ncbi:MAG TPA: protease modulator HflC [Candidatus Marinimicrobia bacterium]|nr:MAG: HflC protein [Candidatus Marinimicrobia bacterium CG1_02_48_14]HCW75294.1 protease modulator HflC [Candidatus Neomarinimicrobiota bacterium]
MRNIITILILVVALGLFWGSAYTIDETQQVVILEFGKPIRTVKTPGLHFKLFWRTVNKFDNRLLEYDSAPNTILTEDKKNLIVDNYAQWRITDPLLFLQSMRTVDQAHSRLDDIIYSSLRVELGKHLMHEIVATKRDSLLRRVVTAAAESANDYGIEILDVRIKRADLPPQNEMAVFDRMSAERSRKAKQFRSEGAEESVKIKAQTDRDREVILADAYKLAQGIRGEGEAEAIKIYAKAFQQDPDFYEFVRSLEAYGKIFNDQTKVVLTPQSDIFKYLKSQKPTW